MSNGDQETVFMLPPTDKDHREESSSDDLPFVNSEYTSERHDDTSRMLFSLRTMIVSVLGAFSIGAVLGLAIAAYNFDSHALKMAKNHHRGDTHTIALQPLPGDTKDVVSYTPNGDEDESGAVTIGPGGYLYHDPLQGKVEPVDKCSSLGINSEPFTGSLSVKTSMDVNSAMEYVKYIDSAQDEIVAVIYKFSDKAALRSMMNALKRGVKVFIIADYTQNNKHKKNVNKLARAGAQVRLFNGYAGMYKLHAKFMVVDDSLAIAGSANLSKSSAKTNIELILVLKSSHGVHNIRCKFWEIWNYGITNPNAVEHYGH
eukprot:CFRG4382T1